MKTWSIDELVQGFKEGNKNALARAITLVESQRADHRELAQELIKRVSSSKKTYRLGISGTPGVGKSSFIEVFGLALIEKKLKVAVLAVDPSSQVSGGSILGDKTRMEELSRNPEAFIRPSPSGGALGGVARRTRECIQLCEAFGFDVIIVETVGVGQSETTVAQLVDCFLMLLQPGAGDDLQGIKRGILELVDMVVVTKADGDNLQLAEAAKHHYHQALHILRSDSWQPPVLSCSALKKTGIVEVWNTIQEFYKKENLNIQKKRLSQLKFWFDQELSDEFLNKLKEKIGPQELENIRGEIQKQTINIPEAISQIMTKLKL